jgi:hypothetical protein
MKDDAGELLKYLDKIKQHHYGFAWSMQLTDGDGKPFSITIKDGGSRTITQYSSAQHDDDFEVTIDRYVLTTDLLSESIYYDYHSLNDNSFYKIHDSSGETIPGSSDWLRILELASNYLDDRVTVEK